MPPKIRCQHTTRARESRPVRHPASGSGEIVRATHALLVPDAEGPLVCCVSELLKDPKRLTALLCDLLGRRWEVTGVTQLDIRRWKTSVMCISWNNIARIVLG